MGRQRRAYLYTGVTVLFWSTSASAFKLCLSPDCLNVNVPALVFCASAVSTVALFAYLIFAKKLSLLKALSRKDYLLSAFLGFLNPFLYYLVLLKAYSILPAQEAQPLNFVWPIMLVLLSIPLLNQKIKFRDVLSLVISFIGVFIISTRGKVFGFKFTSGPGVALALGSTVIWSLFWIYNAKDERDEAVRLFVNFAFASFYAFAVFLVMLFFAKIEIPSLFGFAGAAYVGLFEMGITFLIWLKALRLSRATVHVASLVYLVPFLSLVVVHFVVGEEIFPSTIIGLVFIVGGIILQSGILPRQNDAAKCPGKMTD